MALDESKENDEVFDFAEGLTFVVEKELLENAKPIKVDMSYTGFVVDSSLEVPEGGCPSAGGSCGTGGGCG